jgi:plasmid replication initiation protein
MNQELVVTKANKLVEASYRLSISEQRVMALLVTQIRPDDEDFKPYRFKVADLEELVTDGERKQQGLYSRVKAITRGLQEKVLQIRTDTGILQLSWLSAAEYFTGQGEVELEFSPRLKPYLLQLQERFTSYKLRYVIKLRSQYSVRLYELLKQYASLGKRSFDLAELRRILGLNDSEFVLWNDFKRFVLERARRELPKKTDLAFNYTARKRGRAVAFIDFEIWHVDQEESGTKKKSALKSGSAPKADELRAHANQCWNKTNGSCAAKWRDHESPNDVCHWCRRFEQQRAKLLAAPPTQP